MLSIYNKFFFILIDSIVERLPLRYFAELLNQGKRLVFTGMGTDLLVILSSSKPTPLMS